MLTTKNAGALISGRVRLTSNKGGKMPEIKQIMITRNTVAGGKAVEVDDVLTVGEEITESEALYLTQIKKAVDVEADIDPSKMTPPEVENREKDLADKTAKRRGKKKGRRQKAED